MTEYAWTGIAYNSNPHLVVTTGADLQRITVVPKSLILLRSTVTAVHRRIDIANPNITTSSVDLCDI